MPGLRHGQRVRDSVNVAVTDWAALIVTTHVAGARAAATAPAGERRAGRRRRGQRDDRAFVERAEQVAPQLMPAGVLVTEPEPVPAFVTVSVCVAVKVAVTDWSALIVTMQVPVPEQPPPLQPVNAEPAAGVAVRVTTVPS